MRDIDLRNKWTVHGFLDRRVSRPSGDRSHWVASKTWTGTITAYFVLRKCCSAHWQGRQFNALLESTMLSSWRGSWAISKDSLELSSLVMERLMTLAMPHLCLNLIYMLGCASCGSQHESRSVGDMRKKTLQARSLGN